MSDVEKHWGPSIFARFGNWNDRTFGRHDSRSTSRRVWRVLDRIAGWGYVRGW